MFSRPDDSLRERERERERGRETERVRERDGVVRENSDWSGERESDRERCPNSLAAGDRGMDIPVCQIQYAGEKMIPQLGLVLKESTGA